MRRGAATVVVALAALAATGCEPPATPTEERIIRIQIEGCKDEPPPTPTPVVIITTPVGILAAAGTNGTVVASADTRAQSSSGATMTLASMSGDPVPVAPSRPLLAAAQLPSDPASAAAMVLEKRRDLYSRLEDKDLAMADLIGPSIQVKQAQVAYAETNYEKAMAHLEVADQEVRRTNVTQSLVNKRIERVLARLKRMQPKLGADLPVWRKRYDDAEKKLAQEGGFVEANRTLAAIERDLDLLEPEGRSSAPPKSK